MTHLNPPNAGLRAYRVDHNGQWTDITQHVLHVDPEAAGHIALWGDEPTQRFERISDEETA